MATNTIILCENALDPATWETIEDAGDVCEFLQKRFITWPQTAKIFHKQVAQNSDVTPCDEFTAERLSKLTGHFYVVVYPEGIETVLIIVAIAVAAAAVGLSFLLRPHTTSPNIPIVNQQTQSPNNALADRQNTQRLGQRIPDIYGKVWSTPDLIQLPYRIFVAGIEQEFCYMCIGRGSYTIDQIREDLTPVSQIAGMSVEVYGPSTSPNSGAPVLRIGTAIGEPVRYVKGTSSVNGQTLIAPNLAGAGFIGAFLIGDATTTQVWFNFTAEAGSYSVASATGIQSAVNTNIEVGVTPVDASGAPTAAEAFTTVTLNGSATLKSRIGATLKVALSVTGMSLVRAHRTSNTNIAANVSVSDEVKWRDCYAVAPVTQADFGDVTTVQTLTLPTPTALAITSRKLNLLVTRNVIIGTFFLFPFPHVGFSGPGPSRYAADILCAIAQDPKIGNRQASEIDFVGIYKTLNDVGVYFGTGLATEFCFTFDDSKVSFEEMYADVCAACFCVGFRRGNLLTISFEKQTVNSTILFNHRNKVPNSETRTVTFGTPNDLDGISLTYIEPNDFQSPNQDIPKTLSFPFTRWHIHSTGGSALLKFQFSIGVDTAGHNYTNQVQIRNTGLATIAIADNHGGTTLIASGATVSVNTAYAGTGASAFQMNFSSLNIGDELNFDLWNPYIADIATITNIVPANQTNFVGANWLAGTGTTITVKEVDSPAVNPQQITAVGIRNNIQAYILGQRLYNKLIYQNTVAEFQCTEEASTLVRNDRILVADNTRSDTQDGEVIDQNGLLLTLSQPVIFIGGRTYTIWLQHPDNTIESIAITQPDATKPKQVVLAGAPSIALVLDPLMYARTTYWVIDSTPQRASAFLLTDKTPQQGKIQNIKSVNYDDRYYFNDVDFIKGFIIPNGPEGTGAADIAAGATYRPSMYNDLNSSSGDTGLGSHAGTVTGFDVPFTPPHNTPPFSDGDPGEHEAGDVIWNGFPPVKISTNTTLSVVVSSVSGTCALLLNGVPATLAGAGTYTAVIPAHTYLSTVSVEAQANPGLGSGASATIVITDITIA